MDWEMIFNQIEIAQGDITREVTDGIVNAVNPSLPGGSGVDGAIHRAAGPELLKATSKLGGFQTGEARISPGFDLKANFIIHTPGPVCRGGKNGENKKVRFVLFENQNHDIYQNVLKQLRNKYELS